MRSLVRRFGKLRLRINESKSTVDWAWKRPFLGLAFWRGSGRKVSVRIAGESLAAMKNRVRTLTRRMRGRSLDCVVADLRAFLVGWKGYFGLADTPSVFRELDHWIRHRLRAYQLKQWKRPRTVFRELKARGMSDYHAASVAAHTGRWWHASAISAIHIALPNAFFDGMGVPRLAP